MIIGSISENKDEEKRISITPDLVKKYISLGFKVLIEKNYGEHLGFLNEDYKKEGCEIEEKKIAFCGKCRLGFSISSSTNSH